MRFTTILAIVASLSSLAAASLLDQLPQCARECVGQNFGGCQTLDIKCICGNKDLISDLSCCVSKSCDAADTNTTIQFAAGLCKTYNIIVPTVASCAASASNTAASSSGANSAASAASVSSSLASKVSSAASLATAPLPAATATPTSSNIAAVNNIGSGVGMGAAIAGLLAVL